MVKRIVVVWIVDGLFIVPYCVHRLLFEAQRDEYAFLIVFPLFWIFGFWGVAGPLVAAWRVHRLMKALESSGSRQQMLDAYRENDGEEVAVDLIASENHIPKFLARKVYRKLFAAIQAKSPGDTTI